MKKNYFMLAFATMMMAACANNDLVDEGVVKETPQAIGFETFAQKATRAVENNSGAEYSGNLQDHHQTFKVWASKQVADNTVTPSSTKYVEVYNGSTVTYGTTWVANPLKFWDKTAESYEFYAAAPADFTWVAANTVGASGTLSLANFSLTGVNNTASELWTSSADKDLMIAAPCTTSKGDYSSVDLNFIHILSRLNINVKSTYDDGDGNVANDPVIMLTGLNVYGLKNTGTFNEATAVAQAGGTTARWTSSGTYTLTGEIPSTKLTSTAVLTHKYLIIPQEQVNKDAFANSATKPSNDAYIQIQYTIDGEPYETYYSLAQAFGIAQSGKLNFNEGWQNTLTIDINPAVISFTGNVATWGTASEGSTPIN